MTDFSTLEKAYSQDILKAIGLLFVTSSMAENNLSLQMARLVCHPHKPSVSAITALYRAELAVRMRQIQTLAYFQVPKPHKETSLKLCDDIKKAFQRRNEFAHFLGDPRPDPEKVKLLTVKMTAKGKVERDKTYTAKQIRGFAEKIYRLTRELSETLDDAGIRKLSKYKTQATQGQAG